MDRKSLNWISNTDIVNNNIIDLKLVGSISIHSHDGTNDEIIFANHEKYKTYSPLFCYKLKNASSKFISKQDPTYFNNSLFKNCSGIWGISKYNRYCVVGIINKKGSKELYTVNKKTGIVCPVSFEECGTITTKSKSCKNKKCKCHLGMKNAHKKQTSKSFISDMIYSLSA